MVGTARHAAWFSGGLGGHGQGIEEAQISGRGGLDVLGWCRRIGSSFVGIGLPFTACHRSILGGGGGEGVVVLKMGDSPSSSEDPDGFGSWCWMMCASKSSP